MLLESTADQLTTFNEVPRGQTFAFHKSDL